MKLRAREATFEIQIEETVKFGKQHFEAEKMKSTNKQKKVGLKRLVWSKQLRLMLRAFNKLKTNCNDQLISERDCSVKDLQTKNAQLAEGQEAKEQQLKKMEEKLQLSQMYKKKKKTEDQKKMEQLICQKTSLEKRNKEIEEMNSTIKNEQLLKEQKLREHLEEIERAKQLLAEKELELENERTLH